METQCGIKWVEHFTTDTAALASTVAGLGWPAKTTMTSVALGQAEAELKYGRENANSVVVVITDGYPLSDKMTYDAAMQLQSKARVIWVPVGLNAPIELIRMMASAPESDHVIQVDGFEGLNSPDVLNKLITDTCP